MEHGPGLKMYFLLDMGIFHCYVRLPEGNMEPQNWWFVDVSPVSFGGIFGWTMLVFRDVSFWYCGMAIHPTSDLEYPIIQYISCRGVWGVNQELGFCKLKVMGITFCYFLPWFYNSPYLGTIFRKLSPKTIPESKSNKGFTGWWLRIPIDHLYIYILHG